eukprot:TRINITY_DN29234_c0_g1_i1.p1 TRINITY_DN29234_c0_g1~~TRINITY_DN29234_c0_g1_i1.p1  ORF type:complete len:406 (+),score=25.21 TRINITY_DN29234_c0_g1_i1:103-1218(+)
MDCGAVARGGVHGTDSDPHCKWHSGPCNVSNLPRQDLFVAGFPCKPFSTSNRVRFQDDWRNHPQVQPFWDVQTHLKNFQPLGVLLENSTGILQASDSEVTPASIVDEAISNMGFYGHKTIKANNSTWIANARQRYFKIAVHNEAGGQEAAEQAVRLAALITASRLSSAPATVESCFMDTLSPTVQCRLAELEEFTSRPAKRFRDAGYNDGRTEVDWTWSTQDIYRSQWSSRDRALAGVRQLQRNVQVIDGCFREFLRSQCIAKSSQEVDVESAVTGLLCDYSQPASGRPWSTNGISKTIKTSTELFSYSAKRRVLPEEHFALLGHPTMDYSSLSDRAIKTLSGNSMSMPSATMLASCIVFTGDFPDLWCDA